MSRNLMLARRLLPTVFDFVIPTFTLPQEHKELRHEIRDQGVAKRWYFVKEHRLDAGNKRYLTQKPVAILPQEPVLVQWYEMNPHLIQKRKYDLRLYVLVTGVDPLRIYLHEGGFVRYAKDKYEPPSNTNQYVSTMHASGGAYKRETGMPFTLAEYWEYLEARYDALKLCQFQDELKLMLIKTLTLVPGLAAPKYRELNPDNYKENAILFQILSMDVIVTAALKPQLLGISEFPNFVATGSEESGIKRSVMIDALLILGLDTTRKARYKEYKDLLKERQNFPTQPPAPKARLGTHGSTFDVRDPDAQPGPGKDAKEAAGSHLRRRSTAHPPKEAEGAGDRASSPLSRQRTGKSSPKRQATRAFEGLDAEGDADDFSAMQDRIAHTFRDAI